LSQQLEHFTRRNLSGVNIVADVVQVETKST
jgi:hypothetical protein